MMALRRILRFARIAVWCGLAGFSAMVAFPQNLPDLYSDELHGDPPFLSEPGWRPLLSGSSFAGWQGQDGKAHEYELPFGQGKRFLKGGNGIVRRLVGGWQISILFSYSSGIPWGLPGNVAYLKEAKQSNINWSSANVRGVAPCVEVWNNNGSITMQPFLAWQPDVPKPISWCCRSMLPT